MESTKFINAQPTKAVHLYRNRKEKPLLKYVDLLVILCKLNVAVSVRCTFYTLLYFLNFLPINILCFTCIIAHP